MPTRNHEKTEARGHQLRALIYIQTRFLASYYTVSARYKLLRHVLAHMCNYFMIFCTVHCNIIIQYKTTTRTFSKLIF